MSERIEAIAAQCRAENWERADLDYMQFAKMIIRECLTFGDIEDPALEQAHNEIKTHFGVEL
jgi:hypothetical protein